MNNVGNISKSLAFGEWLNWLNSNFPGSKQKILSRVNGYRLGQDDVVDDPAWYEQVINAASSIIPTYYNYKMQSKLVDAQIARAQAGQAPLDPTYFRAASNIAPTVRHEISTGMSDETMNMLLLGGAGLVAYLMLS